MIQRASLCKKNLIKTILIASLALCAIIALAGCTKGAPQNADSSSSDGSFTLAVGFDQGYPPYGYVGDDGQFSGFDLDLARAVCKQQGWKLKLVPIDWSAKDALMASGAINCIWNGFTIEGREDKYTFSNPYMLNKQVIIAKSGSGITTKADLAHKSVLTQADSAALAALKKPTAEGGQADLAATFKSLQTIGDYNSAFMQLQSGLVDAVACDLSIAAYQMAANPGAYQQVDVLSTEHYAVGFKKGNTTLAKQVSDALEALNKDGTVEQLCKKYASQGINYDNWVQ